MSDNNRGAKIASATISVAKALDKGKFSLTELISLIAGVANKKAKPSEKISLCGAHELICSTNKRDRQRIIQAFSNYSYEFEFTDEFPFNQDELRTFQRVNNYLDAPETLSRSRVMPYQFPMSDTASKQTSRASAKNEQLAEFDKASVMARLKISEHKFERSPEAIIAELLNKKYGLRTRKGNEFSQGQVNKQYAVHREIWSRFLPSTSDGVALLRNLNKPVEGILETDTSPPVKQLAFDHKALKEADNLAYEKIEDLEKEENDSLDFFPTIDLKFSGAVLNGEKRFFLKFTSDDGHHVEGLSVSSEAIKKQSLSIDIIKDTLLKPGIYHLELFDENGLKNGTHLDKLKITVGKRYNSSPYVEMHRTKHNGKIVAILRRPSL